MYSELLHPQIPWHNLSSLHYQAPYKMHIYLDYKSCLHTLQMRSTFASDGFQTISAYHFRKCFGCTSSAPIGGSWTYDFGNKKSPNFWAFNFIQGRRDFPTKLFIQLYRDDLLRVLIPQYIFYSSSS
jgi:hypothetical protein